MKSDGPWICNNCNQEVGEDDPGTYFCMECAPRAWLNLRAGSRRLRLYGSIEDIKDLEECLLKIGVATSGT